MQRNLRPVHLAAWNGNAASLVTLMKYQVDPDVQDEMGWTPLHYAVAHGHITCAWILLDFGATVDSVDFVGNTPLMYAVETNSLEIIELLLAFKADPNLENKLAETPWLVAEQRLPSNVLERMQGSAVVATLTRPEWLKGDILTSRVVSALKSRMQRHMDAASQDESRPAIARASRAGREMNANGVSAAQLLSFDAHHRSKRHPHRKGRGHQQLDGDAREKLLQQMRTSEAVMRQRRDNIK